MLIRHTAVYALSRGVPALVSLLGLALYTRLLAPQDFGQLALLLVVVGAANTIGFHWLRVAAIRYLPAEQERRPGFLRTLYATYGYLAGVVLVIAIAAFALANTAEIRGYVVLGALLLGSQTWFELNLELRLAALEPVRYGVLAIVRAVLAIAAGGLLAYLGYGAPGVVIGTSVGFLITGVVGARADWSAARAALPDWTVVRRILAYGLPFTGVAAFAFVTSGADRLLLGWFAGTAAVGQYAAASDLTLQTVSSLMMLINLSALPIAVRAYETIGPQGAVVRLREQAVALMALALPTTAGLVLLAPDIAAALLGDSFRESARTLIPVVAAGAFLAGLKAYYFDIAFQLTGTTMRLLWISVGAAVLSLALNVWWIPRFGSPGAAYAMAATFLVACGASAFFGSRLFPMPVPAVDWAKIALATAAMAAVLWPYRSLGGSVALLLVRIVAGAAVYVVVAVLVDTYGSRRFVAQAMNRGRRST